MKLLHCNSCHHEWEGKEGSLCGWCGSSSYVLKSVNTEGIINTSKRVVKDLRRKRNLD